jgi:hypothetical protein
MLPTAESSRVLNLHFLYLGFMDGDQHILRAQAVVALESNFKDLTRS